MRHSIDALKDLWARVATAHYAVLLAQSTRDEARARLNTVEAKRRDLEGKRSELEIALATVRAEDMRERQAWKESVAALRTAQATFKALEQEDTQTGGNRMHTDAERAAGRILPAWER